MRITYFRLKGYIKVLNGMGLDEIILPFDTFKNRIVLIQGENGCSKSTIISALTPNPDSSDDFRTDVFIDSYGNRQIIEYPAEKEIHYTDIDENGNENYYSILIQSIVDDSKTRRTTKAFISKNGEELNPNGNISSFKEIRDSVLGIDPIYLDLSSISAENRGIVDMIPSERRKYMAAYIGSLDTYNNIFKVISKKVSSLKSYMNTINSKMYELGDENELRFKLMQLESSLTDLNTKRDDLIKNLTEAETIVKMIDPENKMQDLYSSISERLVAINSEIKRNDAIIMRICTDLGISLENTDLSKLQKDVNDNLQKYKDTFNENKSKISTLISLNESTLTNMESDRTILNGLNSNIVQDNIEVAVDKIKNDIETYEKYLTEEDIKILKSTSIDELNDLRESLDNFIKEIGAAEELYTIDEYNLAVDYAMNRESMDFSNNIHNMMDSISKNEIKIAFLKKEIESAKEDISILNDFDNTRPKECIIDSCPYISRFIDIKNNYKNQNDIDEMYNEIKCLEESNIKTNNDINILNHVDEIVRRIDIALSILNNKKSIIKKIKSIEYLNDINIVKSKLKDHYKFYDFNIVSDIIEKFYIYMDLEKTKEQFNSLDKDLKIYKNNKTLIESLNSSIQKNENEYNNRENEIKSISKDNNFLLGLIEQFTQKLENISNLIIEVDGKNKSLIEKKDLKNEFDSVKDNIRLVKEKIDLVNSIKNDINKIEESIKPLSETITQIKYSLTNIVYYQQEYKESSDKYEKMVFIRNACSPGNGMGIQSEYIKRYMNDIIIDCNKMLGYMFGGAIQLDVPVINEKQFSIPFIGPNGIMVPDISNGSTAQKCMIGLVFSCVAMMKSSVKYNIPRFDEIDGGLDQQNRITFINVLNQVLDFMRSEQCIICSHNIEFDSQNTTRLIFSRTGIRIEQ